VQRFPEHHEGLMRELYEGIEVPRLAPSFLYSFNALGEVAVSGNPQAIQKIVAVLSHVDGAVAEKMCDVVSQVVAAHETDFERAACTSKDGVGQTLSECGRYLGESDDTARVLKRIAGSCSTAERPMSR
jgi:ubiquinone biosynthesis protein UbiJ